MNKIALSLVFILALFNTIIAQENAVSVQVPPAPNAASLGEYGDIPVGEFSGTANVSVPIHTISTRAGSVPISLNYHTNGIRVAEEAGVVGLGWALSAGGMITRTIRGRDDFGETSIELLCNLGNDEYDNYWSLTGQGAEIPETDIPTSPTLGGEYWDGGYIKDYIIQGDIVLFEDNSTLPGQDFCFEGINTYKDYESDLYSFNFAGYSGKFVIDRNGYPKLLTMSDLDISISVNDTEDVSWIVLTPDGRRFSFGQTRESRQLTYQHSYTEHSTNGNNGVSKCHFPGEDPDRYISTWYLNEIETPVGGSGIDENIYFTYEIDVADTVYIPFPSYSSRKTTAEDISIGATNNLACVNPPPPIRETRTFTYTAYDNIYLERIHAPAKQEEVIFDVNSGRNDLKGGVQLDRVTVKRNNQIYSEIRLDYGLFEQVITPTINRWLDNNGLLSGGVYTVDFEQNNVPNYVVTAENEYTRLKLEQVSFLGDDGADDYFYSFDYHGGLPSKASYATDYWGFNNGEIGNRSFFSYINENFSYSYPGPEGMLSDNINVSVGGYNREVGEDHVQSGLLYKVTYPTGGHTIFEYESHEFQVDEYAYVESPSETHRVVKGNAECDKYSPLTPNGPFLIEDGRDNPTHNIEVSLSWEIKDCDCTIDFENCISITPGGSHHEGFRFVLEDDNGNEVRSWHWNEGNQYGIEGNGIELNDELNNVSSHTETLEGITEGSYYIKVVPLSQDPNLQDLPANLLEAIISVSWDEFEPIDARKGGGNRIKTVMQYSDEETVANSKSYSYLLNDNTSGVAINSPVSNYIEPLMTIFSNSTIQAQFALGQGFGFGSPVEIPGGPDEWVETTHSIEVGDPSTGSTYFVTVTTYTREEEPSPGDGGDPGPPNAACDYILYTVSSIQESASIFPLSSSLLGNMVSYSNVRVTQADNGYTDKHFFIESPNFIPDLILSEGIPRFVNGKTGSLLSEKHFTNQGDEVANSTYHYADDWGGTYNQPSPEDARFSLHWNFKEDRPVRIDYNVQIIDPCIESYDPHIYSYADVPQWHRLDYVVTNNIGQNGGVSTSTTSYEYEYEHFNQRSIEITGPGGNKRTEYRYPHDQPSEFGFMLDQHMRSIPVEVIAPNGSTYFTEYSPNYFVPRKFTEKFPNGDLVVRTEVNDTDFNGAGYPLVVNSFQLPEPTELAWNSIGQLTSKNYKDHTETWAYDPIDQNLKSYTSIDGQTVTYLYDNLQRPEVITARGGGIVTTNVYTIGGPNEIVTTTSFLDDPDNTSISRQIFDGLGRPLESYLNNELQEGRRYNSQGRISSQTFMPDRWKSLFYERSPLNRVRWEIYPDNGRVRYEYIVEEGHNGVRVRDEKGIKTKVLTDVFGRTYKTIDALGGVTEYQYNNWDAPEWIQPPLGKKYEYNYNLLRQLTSKYIPGGGTTTYTYDDKHRLAATQPAQGDFVGNVYDSYGRLYQTHLKGVFPSPGQPYVAGGDSELLTENRYTDPAIASDPDVGRLMQSSVKFLEDGLGMTVTDYSYDEYGRLEDQTELFTLNGETHSLVTTPENFTHRDLPGVMRTSHYRNVTSQNPTNGEEYALVTSSVFDNFGRTEDLSHRFSNYPAGGSAESTLNARWNASFDYDLHGQMEYKRFFQNPLSSTWYGEDYSYNSRGWLTRINRPLSRDYDVDDCGIPEGNVYQGGSVVEDVSFEQLLEYLLSGEVVNIPVYNECPTDPPVNPPVQQTCLQDVVDSYMNIDERTGLPIDHAVGFIQPFTDVESDYTWIQDVRLTSLKVTLATYNTGSGEELIILPSQYEIYKQDFVLATVDTPYMEQEWNRLISDLETWAEQEGISLPSVNIEYENGRLDIYIKEAGVEFLTLKVSREWMAYGYDEGPDEVTFLTDFSSKDFRFNHANFYQIDCKEIKKSASGDGSVPSTITYPFEISEVKITNTTPSLQFLTEEELDAVTEKYEVENKYSITQSDQQINLELQSGSELVVSVDGFFDAKDNLADPIVSMDLPVNEKGQPITIPINENPCPVYNLPACPAEGSELQIKEVDEIISGIDPTSLTYPVTLSYIMLCNGQRVLVIGTEQELENSISGEFYYLDGELVTGPDQLFSIRRKVPDGLFNLELEYEKNGNIDLARWKTTYHHTRYYEYTYDDLNRLESATYGLETPAGSVPPDIGQGFTADNFSYDALGNILSLRRYAQLTPGAPGILIDDLRYKYDNSLDFGQAAAPGSNIEDMSQLLAVQELATNPEGLANGFMPGSASITDVYSYDPAGNLTGDPYKGISIVYNHLNLPEQIGDIKILYDANGRKWQMEYPDGTIHQYIGGMEFVDDEFESTNLGDGRIYAAETSPGSGTTEYIAEYWHKDQLGNTRVAFADRNSDGVVQLLDGPAGASEVNQTLDYYPFGLQHPGAACQSVTEPENAYRYNGKELLEEYGYYFYGFRIYDPAIARFPSADPIADQFPFVSVYNYAENEPIGGIDLWGLQRLEIISIGAGGLNSSFPERELPKDFTEYNALLLHPYATYSMGKANVWGGTSLTTVVGRFAANIRKVAGLGVRNNGGGQQNAIRHTLWSAMVHDRHGHDVWETVTNAHEGIGPNQAFKIRWDYASNGDEGLADSMADLLNNDIGAGIGTNNPGATAHEYAALVLERFFKDGLWMVSVTNGEASIQKTRLTQEEYNCALNALDCLSKHGFTPDQLIEVNARRASNGQDPIQN